MIVIIAVLVMNSYIPSLKISIFAHTTNTTRITTHYHHKIWPATTQHVTWVINIIQIIWPFDGN
jgi:hypothetical protein